MIRCLAVIDSNCHPYNTNCERPIENGLSIASVSISRRERA